MGDHDLEIMDDGCIDRDDAGPVGVVAAGRQSADPAFVYAGARGGVSKSVP
jgi:hypothetical protein